MRHSGRPKVVISGIGVVSPFGVGPRTLLGPRATAAAAAHARSPSSTRRRSAARSPRQPAASRSTMCRRSTGEDIWDPGLPRRPEALLARGADRRHRRARSVERRRPAHRRAGRRRHRRQRRRRHRRRRARSTRLLRRARAEGHALRDSGVDRRHGVERDFDLAAAARRQPRAVVRLHQLDRRHRLRGRAHPVGRGRRAAVGRRRRVRDAGHDLRLLADEGGVDGATTTRRPRRRGRSTAAATGSCSARARGWWCSSARIAPGRAARTIYASDRRLRIDLRRVPPRADGAGRRARSSARSRWRSSDRARPRDEIGYVSYHGTSTVLNDAVESRCVREVFGDHAERLAGIVGQVDDRPPAGRERRRPAS